MTTYTSFQVAAIVGCNRSTLVRYEKLGLIPKAKRAQNGLAIRREYTEADVAAVREAIKRLPINTWLAEGG